MLADDLKEVVVDVLRLSPAKLTRETSLTRDMNVDSIDVLRLVQALEKKFGINIDTEQLDLLDNLELAERYIASLLVARR